MRNAFPGAVPEIPVSDINKATAYYESSLGFNIDCGDAEGGIAGISKYYFPTNRPLIGFTRRRESRLCSSVFSLSAGLFVAKLCRLTDADVEQIVGSERRERVL